MNPSLPFLLALLLSVGCAGSHERRDPTGEVFPSVRGESLEGREYAIPGDFAGAPVLLLVGYVQDAQFDIDRWLLGLWQARINVRTHELPTIRGMVPRAISGYIDNGMRKGIPAEDWGAVITIYGDASDVTRFTGDKERRRNARVLLLDADGRVVFFHDAGYSVRALARLENKLTASKRNKS